MIKLTKGNLLKSDAEALVNTANCAGYMGKGIEKKEKRKKRTPIFSSRFLGVLFYFGTMTV